MTNVLALLLPLFFAALPGESDLARLESAKNVGLAALEEGNLDEARRRFRVTSGGRTQTRELQVSPSYASGTLTDLHFGLGDATSVEVEVRWPDGPVRRFANVPAGTSIS